MSQVAAGEMPPDDERENEGEAITDSLAAIDKLLEDDSPDGWGEK